MRYERGVVLPPNEDQRMHHAFSVLESVFRDRALGEPVITHYYDGIHSRNSYHNTGRAVDIRTKGTGSARYIYQTTRNVLRPLGFDVLLEDEGEVNEHLHIEIDRRADQLARGWDNRRARHFGPSEREAPDVVVYVGGPGEEG